MTARDFALTQEQVQRFHQQGYLVVPQWVQGSPLQELQQLAQQQLSDACAPLELEAQLGYPGAPENTQQLGGKTPRRLLGAYARHPQWQALATGSRQHACLNQLFGEPDIFLSQCHHNCLMTKSPAYSSDTGWHQDSRYWSFTSPDLITMWLALGSEKPQNGGLHVIPGSHKFAFDKQQFDDKLFFREDSDTNKTILEKEKALHLNAGDMLFFHCNLLHRASRNFSDITKLSLVFTYHSSKNTPTPDTRSASQPSILISSP